MSEQRIYDGSRPVFAALFFLPTCFMPVSPTAPRSEPRREAVGKKTDMTKTRCNLLSNSPSLSNSAVGVAGRRVPQVHQEETSGQPQSLSSYRSFITSGCTRQIAAARLAYDGLNDLKADSRLLSFDSCRTNAWFVRHKVTGEIRVASKRCGLRWCPLCIRTRRFVITAVVAGWLRTADRPKFLTLTLKHNTAPLEKQVSSLYGFFKELKRRPWFKKRLKGGIWFFQVKLSESDGLWHPHLHILFEGKFLPHAELSQKWKEITHGSSVVDIRSVKNPKKVAEYVARYAAAPCDLADLDSERALDVVRALFGRRIVGTFGTGRSIKLTVMPPDDAADWEYMESFSIVMRNAVIGSVDDVVIVTCWRSGESCPILPAKPPPEPMRAGILIAEPEQFRQAYLPF